MEDSDDSFFDSTGSALSTAGDSDEEARIGTRRKQRTMHSVPKGSSTKKGDYGSARQDDYSEDDDTRDDDKAARDGNDSLGSDADSAKASDESAAVTRKKKRRHSSTGAGSDTAQAAQSSSKKWWYIGAALAVLLAALIFGGLYLYNKNKSDSASSATESAASSPAVSSDSIATPVTATPTLASPTSVTTSGLASSTLETMPSRTSAAAVTKSSSQDDPAPSATYAAQITWYKADHETTECGTKPTDDDYVVRISPELYGDANSVSPLCGTWITLYQLEKDATARATIEGISPNMTGHNLDLSPKVFKALTANNLELGMTLAQWWLTDDKHRPHSSLSRPSATSSSDWDGEAENDQQHVTIATVPNPTGAVTAAGNEPQAIAGGGFRTAESRM